jgi:hypothetical protein
MLASLCTCRRDFNINRKEDVTCHLKIRGASGKLKNQPRPLLRPSSVNFCQHFFNLSQETVSLNCRYFPDPDIEEDEDTCIVRIAPKPIKIKIKSLPPPPPSSGAGDSVPPTAAAAVPAAAAAVQPAPPPAPATTPYMHPKKKMAHTMDYLINNDHVAPAMLSHVQQSPQVNAASFPLSVSAPVPPPLAASGAANSLLARAPLPTAETPVRSRRESGQQERRGGRERNGTASSGRKAGGADVRTKCDVCLGEGTNANLVRYGILFVLLCGCAISIFFLESTETVQLILLYKVSL